MILNGQGKNGKGAPLPGLGSFLPFTPEGHLCTTGVLRSLLSK